ncbi:hypothetical protein [Nostoc sp. C117]|uniref:hypothetical protein n=1 Tax=Nostoc sp. C117 TaxID=3349875 RepID=UPI00370DDB5F
MSRYFFGFAFVLNILLLIFPKIVWAGSASSDSTNINSNPVDTSQTSTSTSEISASPASTTPTQSASIYQNYGYGSNPLNYPNCGGVCAFGIVRLSPNGNGTTNQEAVMGVVVEFDSPQKRLAIAQENLSKAQSDRMIQEDEVSLLTKIADAVEQCKDSHVNLLALSAAKKLGMTPEEILSRAYKQPRQCNSHRGN